MGFFPTVIWCAAELIPDLTMPKTRASFTIASIRLYCAVILETGSALLALATQNSLT